MKQKGHVWAAALVVALCIAFSALTSAESPSWWTTRGVLNTNWPANDYAPVLAGQLKWMATNAAAELETLPGGAGTGIHALVSGFTPSNNYVPINLGQLKNTAAPFYQRLMIVGYATNYPWSETTADDADFAPAMLGQLKHVFDFDVSADTDDDGLPDWWERKWGLCETSAADAQGDIDGDDAVNLAEYYYSMNPTNTDSDLDGMPDGWEFVHGLNPVSEDAEEDADNDGLNNLQEYRIGTYPENPDSDNDQISDGVLDPDGSGPLVRGADPNPLAKALGQLPSYTIDRAVFSAESGLRVAEDTDGRPIVAWRGKSPSGARRAYVAKCFGSAPGDIGEWALLDSLWEGFGTSCGPDGVTGATNEVSSIDLCTDTAGNPVLLWSDTYGRHISLLRWQGTNWVGADGSSTSGVCITTNEYPWYAGYAALALISNERPVVAYLRNNTNLHVKQWAGSRWAGMDGTSAYSVVAVDDTHLYPGVHWVSVDVGTDDCPVVAYVLNQALTNVCVRKWAGTNDWPLFPSMGDSNGVHHPSMLLDTSGAPHIAWMHDTWTRGLHVREYHASNNQWTGYGGSAREPGLITSMTVTVLGTPSLWKQTNGAMGVVWPQGYGSSGVECMTSLYMKVWNTGYMCWTSIGRSITGPGINAGGRPVIWACATASFGKPVVACAEDISGGDAYTYLPVVRRFVADSDGDGLSDVFEEDYGTEVSISDTDGDGLSDGMEWRLSGTSATNADTDGDGLSDGDEFLGTKTGFPSNPLLVDSDGDGIADAIDVFVNSPYDDQDGDGIPDSTDGDADNDGLTNGSELVSGCPNVMDPDSDDDGVPDGAEYENGSACTSSLPSDTNAPTIYITEPEDGASI